MLIIGWVVGAFIVGLVATGKDRSFIGHFLVSLLLSPLIGLLILIALPSLKGDIPAGRVPCLRCHKAMKPNKPRCPHCGTDQAKWQAELAARPALSGDGRPQKKCPSCAEMILTEAVKCRYCGTDLAAVKA